MTAAETEAASVVVNGDANNADAVDGPEVPAADAAGVDAAKEASVVAKEKLVNGDATEAEKMEAEKREAGKKEEKEETVDIDSLMAQGKRDFYCGEYLKSVSALQRVCEEMAKQHGEMADQIAEPYLLYGKALLEVARIESDVLGNALDGIPEEQEAPTPAEANDVIEKDSLTEEEKEKISEQVLDAMTEEEKEAGAEKKEEEPEKASDADQDAEMQEDDEKAKEQEQEEEGKEQEEAAAAEQKTENGEKADAEEAKDEEVEEEAEEEEEEGEGEGEGEEEEEDVGNLQIAWEVLEVARKIFERREDWQRVAECHACLAEVGMEKEDWSQAEEDLASAIGAYTEKAKVEKGDRRLATAYFQLAVASLADKKYAESKRAFDDSIGHLQARAGQLSDQLKSTTGESLSEARRAELEKEVKDLDELIDELRQRIVEVDEERIDFEVMRKQLRSGVSSIAGGLAQSEAPPAVGSNGAESADGVNDISGLVRKKRKVEEPSETVAPSPSKRPKTDADANGGVHPDADMPLADEATTKAKTVEDVKKLAAAGEEQQQQQQQQEA